MPRQVKKSDQTERESRSNVLTRSLQTGFAGGLIGGVMWVILYYFNFSEIAPKHYLLSSWTAAGWVDSWLGTVISILMISIISILVALIYFGTFKTINSVWIGVFCGVVLWFIVFYILKPIFPNIPYVTDLSADTIVSTICLYILYGVFIGFSISYDYHDTFVKSKTEQTE
ncbi:YqhR family membrane protein [Barrientosiimonas marina]|uniref:YqhR family membrane protein n=1 Tax=Lentibacillus kimchii TaxID=1542911 RepID=A0ABW2UXV6_9BACI